jgi:signal transduction histidine kinase
MGAQPEPHIRFGVREDDGATIFFVEDNGIGVDERYQQVIFGLFNKLDAKSGGTGIGLALVKRIIEEHGGRVWVESEGLGKGSRFCFTVGTIRR